MNGGRRGGGGVILRREAREERSPWSAPTGRPISFIDFSRLSSAHGAKMGIVAWADGMSVRGPWKKANFEQRWKKTPSLPAGEARCAHVAGI